MSNDNKRIEELEKENLELNNRIKKLEKELEDNKKELDDTNRSFKNIKREFEEFKAKHGITVSNLKVALKIKPNLEESKTTIGAPKHHKGYSRKIPERIDHIMPLNPETCPDCGGILPEKASEIRSRHVTDIKLISEIETTRYDIYRKYCKNCKKIVEPKVPNVLPHARFGLNLMLLIMYLRLGLRLPGNKICEYFLTLYDLSISEAEIVVILRQLVNVFGDYYSSLEKLVKIARIKHTDTTSWRVNGKNYFAWVFIAAGTVLYKIRKRNNSNAAITVFGTKQKGNILVIDRFSALRKLAKKCGFVLQLCWSHILDDSKKLEQNFGSEGIYIHKKLKEIFELATGLEHKGTPWQVEQLKALIFMLTQRHYKHITLRRFVDNLYYRDVENLFIFVTDPDVDPTNNISERELRALVIIRKISNGSRSTRGANATAMLLSVIQTLRFNKKNILQGLQNIINNPSGY